MNRLLRLGPAGCLLVLGCSGTGDPSRMPPLPPFDVRVDGSLPPGTASLPGLDGTPGARPVAALAGGAGHVGMFVERELVVTTDDRAALDALVARWGGEVLASIDPTALPGMPAVHLVRIDPAGVDAAGLEQDLRALNPDMTDELRVSSEAGLRTLAAAAREAAGGMEVGINFVAEGSGFIERMTVDYNGAAQGSNAFAWTYMRDTGALRTGVAEAWRALALADRLDNRVALGVVDGGFLGDHPDYPDDTSFPDPSHADVASSMTCGMDPCNWHGTGCVLTAAGVVDNMFGAAGSGGPVASPILARVDGGMFSMIGGLNATGGAGARITSMSLGFTVPPAFAWGAGAMSLATANARASGHLVIASAGNSMTDVDENDCFIECWEDTLWYPCESNGVLCVGSTNWSDDQHAGYTNWGTGVNEDTVDFFAPGCELVAELPNASAMLPYSMAPNNVEMFCGTSAATPFLAGIAALVWAADPSLSDDAVESLLRQESRGSTDPKVRHVVDAYHAVLEALGGTPGEAPVVDIIYPADGAEVGLGEVTVIATLTDANMNGPYTLTWSTDVDGMLATGPSAVLVHTFATPGLRQLTLTATDAAGDTGSTEIDLNVVNGRPDVEITTPIMTAFRGVPVHLRGTAIDPDEGDLPCGALLWTKLAAGDTLSATSGCEIDATFGLPNGPHAIHLSATDEHGAGDATALTVMVTDPPADPPPTGRILTPPDGMHYVSDMAGVMLSGEVMDSEPVTVRWTARWSTLRPMDIGTALSFTWVPASAGLDCSFVERPVIIELRANDGTADYVLDSITIILDCYPG